MTYSRKTKLSPSPLLALKARFFWRLLVVVYVFGAGESSAACQVHDSNSPMLLTARLEPSRNADPFPAASVDAGVVEVGSDSLFEISLENATGSDISFERVTAGCSCTEVSIEGRVLQVSRAKSIKLRYLAPKSTFSGPMQSLKLYFYNRNHVANDTPVAAVYIKLSLSGNLVIDTRGSVFEATDDGVAEWRLPVHFSSPVSRTDLLLEKSPEFKDVRLDFEDSGDKTYLVAQIESHQIPKQGLKGVITVRDDRAKKRATASITIARQSRVVASPTLSHLRRDEEGHDSSTVIVLLRITGTREGSEAVEIEKLDCALNGEPVKLTIQRLGNQVYKVKVICPVSALKRESDSNSIQDRLNWQVKLSDEFETISFDTLVLGAPE